MAFAHSRNHRGERHDLVAHLRAVGQLTARFAEPLGAQMAGYWLGLWHDVGKFDPQWQQYLLASEAGAKATSVDHKAAGTMLAVEQQFGPLASIIQGHHGGLQPLHELSPWIKDRGARPGAIEAVRLAREAVADLVPRERIELPSWVRTDPLAAELFLRLLFAALIDADRLDTERHTAADAAALRGTSLTLEQLWARFAQNQAKLTGHRSDPVGRLRHEIYQACLAAADQPPGVFRLAVPTGGGKTRSGMAFALRHALRHGLDRIIVAVPFITITQQTAAIYRDIFRVDAEGRPAVLEHHSAVQRTEGDGDEFEPAAVWARLAAENWDAPIIVTTTVQLFESLFANSTSATRKLHRLARSVLILDEAQSLPPHLMEPILDALRQLSARYQTTVVLSTATQPAFDTIRAFRDVPAHEIVPNPNRYFEALRRVVYEWGLDPPLTWTEVAELMRTERQALAVVNTKADAIALLDALGDDALHLSTLLCGAHRNDVIAEVKRRLAADEPCLLVSTQVVEAGVDLDFPIVLRALAPLDSIIQAAGRCNREGWRDSGRVIVFRPADGGLPPGSYRVGAEQTEGLVSAGGPDPHDPGNVRTYFERWLGKLGTEGVDRERIQELRRSFDYPEVARRFQMIDGDTETVIVTGYGSSEDQERVLRLIDRLRARVGSPRQLMRQLQPYAVAVRTTEARRFRREGLIGPELLPGVSEWLGDYDAVRGILAKGLNLTALVV